MDRNYWRIGVEYIDLELFEEGYPYFWGGAVTGINVEGGDRKAYINHLSEVRIGDILVAGGTKNIKYVGEIISTPVYLFEEDGPKNGDWDEFGISEADFDTQEIFKPYKDEGYSDVVCIKTKWFKIDCSQLKMPESQTLGSFTSLNGSGKKYIESVLPKESIMNGVTIENCLHLLQANKNLILTGAPGTGKTYLAKQIAQQMLFGETKDEEKLDDMQKALFKEHCGFVQFHPSYDYTDFVEGLRPTPPSDNGQIGFELKKGVFKEFCERALKAATVSGVDNFDEAWKKLTDTIVNEDEISVPLNSTKKTRYGISDAASLRFLDISAGTLTKDNIYNVYRGLKGRTSGAYQNYMQAVVSYMKEKCGLLNYKPSVISSSESQKYIFVIDEINRGEISKIFGELFFSIDPGYRGEKGKVQTQYANLIPEGDIFYDGFFVPENVYIIGTMNDIDRSVESFDFAMRRRFVWQEITAEQSADNMHLPASSNERMKHLNEAISKREGLNAAYHIGGAYFLKLEKCNGDYAKLWNHHIEPLLKEYLRGLPDAKDDLKSLENAYNLNGNG